MKEENNKSVITGEIAWPKDLFSAKRVLTHFRYNGYYHPNHPKWIALQDAMNKAMANKSRFTSTFKIELPSPGYKFTDPAISGHGSCEIIEDKFYLTDDNGNKVLDENGDPIEVPSKTTLFCLFDLMVPVSNETQCISKRPVLEDDFDAD